MISYSGLLRKLPEKGLTESSLTTELGLSSRTVAKIRHGEKLTKRVLEKIAAFLDCSADELCQPVSENRKDCFRAAKKQGQHSPLPFLFKPLSFYSLSNTKVA